MSFEGVEGVADFLVVAMASQIDVEDVFPVLLLGGAGFDLGHVDFEGIEGLEGLDEGAGSVVDGEEDAGAVLTGGGAGFFADDEEAGGIGGAVLDGGFEDGQAAHFSGERSTHGGGSV